VDPAAVRKNKDPWSRVIPALDTDSLDQACQWIDRLPDRIIFYKIGSQLFTAAGPRAVAAVKAREKEVFLDLKFHDIPNTVRLAVQAAASLGVKFLNVHAMGGPEMIGKAVEGAAEGSAKFIVPTPKVLAVTILTSLDKAALSRLGLQGDPETCVLRLAEMAVEAGVDGLIASPQEITAVRRRFGDDVLLVTPGIRPEGSVLHDQKRTMSPQDALRAGADFLVMGRSLLAAPNPVEVLEAMEPDTGMR
jgi:orotidine-5'-phosphate decarboxylase